MGAGILATSKPSHTSEVARVSSIFMQQMRSADRKEGLPESRSNSR